MHRNVENACLNGMCKGALTHVRLQANFLLHFLRHKCKNQLLEIANLKQL